LILPSYPAIGQRPYNAHDLFRLDVEGSVGQRLGQVEKDGHGWVGRFGFEGAAEVDHAQAVGITRGASGNRCGLRFCKT
jgi:hypothetical protein